MPSNPFYSSTILVALGGGAGATLRYWLGLALQPAQRIGGFPYATFTANVVGSLLMGVLVGWLARQGGDGAAHPMAVLLGVGLLGGFTTFSTFSLDMVRLVESGSTGLAVLYASLSLIIGLSALFIGLSLARPA